MRSSEERPGAAGSSHEEEEEEEEEPRSAAVIQRLSEEHNDTVKPQPREPAQTLEEKNQKPQATGCWNQPGHL